MRAIYKTLPAEEIFDLYENHYVSTVRLGEKYGVGDWIIRMMLRRAGHKLRNTGAHGYRRPSIKIPKDPVILSYIAGLVDGEGHIAWITANGQKAKMPQIGITNTEHSIMDFLTANLGGVVTTEYKHSRNPKNHDCYRWFVRRVADVALLLDAIYPYLVIPRKRKKAEAILKWCEKRQIALQYWKEMNAG